MKTFSISNDIIPLGKFKTNLSKYLKEIRRTKHPLIITQNGHPAGVLLSPEEYDLLVEQKQFIESVERGLKNVETGEVFTTNEMQAALKKQRLLR